jgi:hypothetical protein
MVGDFDYCVGAGDAYVDDYSNAAALGDNTVVAEPRFSLTMKRSK